LSYQPRRELFMIPLAAAVLLLLGYHLLMLLVSLALRLFSRRDKSKQAADSDVFQVHV
jgi:Ca-activated chloride channel family protein